LELAELVRAHRANEGQLLASGPRGRTTRQGAFVVKETVPRPGVLGRLAAMLRPSRARRAHEAALVLARAGVPVAEPIGVIDEAGRAFAITRFVDGKRLDLAADPGRIVDAARLAARVHACGVAHGDFKPANLLVTDGSATGLVIVDLDAATVRGGPPSRRSRARDLASLDAYGQRGAVRVARRTRRAAFEAYLEGAPFETDRRALLRAVLKRSLLKRARWLAAARGS
jgi:tRNA A-37 threonylcarbamoyl transferase component Bud32